MTAETLIDRLMQLRSASAPAFSKDGRTLFHLADDSGQMQIWSLDIETGTRRQLTALDEPVGFLARSPADDTLVFGGDRGGDERQQLHLLAPGADGPAPLTDAPEAMHVWGAWAPDGKRIAYTANSRDGMGFDLYVMELDSRETRRVAEFQGQQTVLSWSPDGALIGVREERGSGDHALRLVDPATGITRTVARANGRATYAALRFRKDGGGAYCLTEIGDFIGLARLDPATARCMPLFSAGDGDVEAAALAPGGDRLAVLVNRQGWSHLLLVDAATGAATPVALPEGVVEGPSWSPDGSSLVFTLTGPDRPRALCLYELATGATRLLLAADTTGQGLVRWRLVGIPSFDGRQIAAWLAEPNEPAPATGRKAVVFVHGGPESQLRPVFRADWQALPLAGYTVLFPNVRGSTGYGRHFASLDDVEKRLDAVEDLRHVRNWLAAQPGIDAGAIAVMGQSYGGFMVLAALTLQPELWKLGIEYYGIGDFLTFFRDTSPWRRRHRAAEYGDAERDRDVLVQASPLTHIDRLKAPLLVAHGKRDPRVPMSESEAVVAALEARGIPVESVYFEHEGHGFTRPDDRRRMYLALLDFLARRL
ncbi:MAG TPA: S9 family peptidase [Aliidongia sp.]|nr:S9 family peptidase [Aliidongia sp.]